MYIECPEILWRMKFAVDTINSQVKCILMNVIELDFNLYLNVIHGCEVLLFSYLEVCLVS